MPTEHIDKPESKPSCILRTPSEKIFCNKLFPTLFPTVFAFSKATPSILSSLDSNFLGVKPNFLRVKSISAGGQGMSVKNNDRKGFVIMSFATQHIDTFQYLTIFQASSSKRCKPNKGLDSPAPWPSKNDPSYALSSSEIGE